MEKQNRPTLTLTLPYIELPHGKEVNDATFYDESGMYFVKSSYGDFHIVEVIKEDNNAFGNPLSLNVGNLFTEQIVINRLEKSLNTISNKLKIIQEALVKHINDKTYELNESIEGLFVKTGDKIGFVNSSLLDVCTGLEDVKSSLNASLSKESNTQSNFSKGSISEDALVQLIKEIKK